MSYSAPNVQR